MTFRRKILASAGVLTVSAIAGCLDALEDDDEGYEYNSTAQQEAAENAQETQEQFESEDDSDGTGQQTTEDDEVENERTREEIVSTYNNGLIAYNDGIEDRESAIRAYNDSSYSIAHSRYLSAEDHFQDAREEYQDAINLTYEINVSDARVECEKAAESALLNRDAMREYQRGAEVAEAENYDQANEQNNSAQELERESNRINVVSTGTLETILGLE